ncbi:protein phosphatase 2C domain-containing protein [Winogradskyella wichelsiae]|uniref:protein phosphatase 2C domain-containing protein n=1 Tax=Winogradskyella wichelsiae TaxID=2697007 RepID=UPI0015C73BEF|nr:protein phosphatase 2C domain-containing protein [Winogradskyella wichelsiae]
MEEKTIENLIVLLSKKGINTSKVSKDSIQSFISEHNIAVEFDSIFKTQQNIMEKWQINSRIIHFNNLGIQMPNGNYGVEYNYSFDDNFLEINNLESFNILGLEKVGLKFNQTTMTIKGIPIDSGDFEFDILFKVIGQNDSIKDNIRIMNFVVNPDPKSLWKNLPSDREAVFWKEDDYSSFDKLGEKSIITCSKRGRSHQNVGSFRDDHEAYKYYKKTGWSIVSVSDGAGSAPLSREGSKMACNSVIEYFDNHLSFRDLIGFEDEIENFSETKDEERWNLAKTKAVKSIYKSITFTHNRIHAKAEEILKETPLVFEQKKYKYPAEYFHSTLIVSIFKKFKIGYVILTFSVGDCPIGIVNQDRSKAKLLNWLDVGEFGGGTRFVTQPEIFHSDRMGSRFSIQIESDFSFLFLMTDGIYDAKFEVEANLEKTDKWLEFISDLEGANETGVKIDFEENAEESLKSLSNWMDFWSKGNHDDRTLSIIY